MPQIELSAVKGLVQKTGQGFADADFQIDSLAAGNLDLTATTTTAAARGALVHSVTATQARAFKLHGTAQGATKGQIKIILSQDDNDLTLQNASGAGVTPATVLTNAGDMAICVFNGTTWVCGHAIG